MRAETEDRPRRLGAEPGTLVDLPDESDWTTAPSEQVAPWRRADRARLDRARALAALPQPLRDNASAIASELRRLAELHGDGALSNEEFVAAARAALHEI